MKIWKLQNLEKMSKVALKYRERQRFGSFYTGSSRGDCALCPRSNRLFLICDESVKVVDATTGQVMGTVQVEADAPSAVALSPDSSILIIASKSGVTKIFPKKLSKFFLNLKFC